MFSFNSLVTHQFLSVQRVFYCCRYLFISILATSRPFYAAKRLLVSYSPLSRASPRFFFSRCIALRFVLFHFVLFSFRFASRLVVSPALSSVLRLRTAAKAEAEAESEQVEAEAENTMEKLVSGAHASGEWLDQGDVLPRSIHQERWGGGREGESNRTSTGSRQLKPVWLTLCHCCCRCCKSKSKSKSW